MHTETMMKCFLWVFVLVLGSLQFLFISFNTHLTRHPSRCFTRLITYGHNRWQVSNWTCHVTWAPASKLTLEVWQLNNRTISYCIFTAVILQIVVLWIAIPCRRLRWYQRFGEIFCLLFHVESNKKYIILNNWTVLETRLYIHYYYQTRLVSLVPLKYLALAGSIPSAVCENVDGVVFGNCFVKACYSKCFKVF